MSQIQLPMNIAQIFFGFIIQHLPFLCYFSFDIETRHFFQYSYIYVQTHIFIIIINDYRSILNTKKVSDFHITQQLPFKRNLVYKPRKYCKDNML